MYILQSFLNQYHLNGAYQYSLHLAGFFHILIIILRLCIPEFVVLAFGIRKELFMGAFLNHGAFMEHRYLITKLAG